MPECLVKFPSSVSRKTISLLVVDFLKYVLYYRGQFPLPLDQLKRLLKKENERVKMVENFVVDPTINEKKEFSVYNDLSNKEGTSSQQKNSSFLKSRAEQVFSEAVTRFDEFFDKLHQLLEKEDILEVILNLGSNMLLPKELYRILLPSWCHHSECSTDDTSFHRNRLQFYKEVMSSSIWGDLASDRPLSISIFLLLAPGASLTDNMEQKRFYKIPKHCTQRIVRFCDNCNQTSADFTQFALESLNAMKTPENEDAEHSALWVKLKPDLRGFKYNFDVNKCS